MGNEPVISCNDLGISFHRYHARHSAKAWLRSMLKPWAPSKTMFWGLRNVTISVDKGDVLGVVGHNGAGKSTLLKMLAGVYQPDEGSVDIRGTISPVMAVGKGLNLNLSGRDNFFLIGSMIGMSLRRLREIYDEAVDFSGVADFMDTPVRYYSSGMKARLSFTVSVYARPDVLLIDEMLGVGDKDFREKAEAKMKEMTASAKAVVIVSHNMEAVRSYCNKVLWMNKGRMHMYGDAATVLEAFAQS